MKLGYIDYLNCYPFYHNMMTQQMLPEIEIIHGNPQQLNRMMADKFLDVSPVSAALYPELYNELVILPEFCLSSVGYVKSVLLFSKLPIEELNNKRIGLTEASKTSVILLKILLEKYFKLKPEYNIAEQSLNMRGLDAQLVIGNHALNKPSEDIPYSYDLGELWLQKTGYPVVFAIFAVQKGTMDRYNKLINTAIKSFSKSLLNYKNNKNEIIIAAKNKYKNIDYDIEAYYSRLHFEFIDWLKEALLFYYSEAAEIKLLPVIKGLNYFR